MGDSEKMNRAKINMELYNKRLFSTTVAFGISALLLGIPEFIIMDAAGKDCEIREGDDVPADGSEPTLDCKEGKTPFYDFFELSACWDPNHGTATAQHKERDGKNDFLSERVVLREYYTPYDHCKARVYPFSSKAYDASDYGLHDVYYGNQRIAGGARLAMMKRGHILVGAITLFCMSILMKFIAKGIDEETREGDIFRYIENFIDILSVGFCGFFVFCSLSTMYSMSECEVPGHLLGVDSRVDLTHAFIEANIEDSPGGTRVLWTEVTTMGTQNKACGPDPVTPQTLHVAIGDDGDEVFCCNNTAAHFMNSQPGDLWKNLTGMNGLSYYVLITFGIFFYFFPLVMFVGKYYAGFPLLDIIGNILLFGASIILLLVSTTSRNEERCGTAGAQLASLGTTGGDGQLPRIFTTLLMTSGITLLLFSVAHGLKSLSSLKMFQDSPGSVVTQALGYVENRMFGSLSPQAAVTLLSLLLAVGFGSIFATNATDVCGPVYEGSLTTARVELVLCFTYVFFVLFGLSGGIFHEKIFSNVPFFGDLYNKGMKFYDDIVKSDAKGMGMDPVANSMGYATNAPMSSKHIKLTTFN